VKNPKIPTYKIVGVVTIIQGAFHISKLSYINFN